MHSARLRLVGLSLSLLLASPALTSCGGDDGGAKGAKPKGGAAAEAADEEPPPRVGVGEYRSTPKDKAIPQLMKAAQNGNADLVELALKDGQDPNDGLPDGLTALHCATGANSPESVRLLLDAKADVDARQAAGATALNIAVFNGRMEIIDMLLEAGADTNLADDLGVAPIHAVSISPNLTPEQRLTIAEALGVKGANLEQPSKDGSTPLIAACHYEHVNLVSFLIEHEVALDTQGNGGFTALHVAAGAENLELCTLLVEAGADVNMMSEEGIPPIGFAALKENSELVEFFQANGAQ